MTKTDGNANDIGKWYPTSCLGVCPRIDVWGDLVYSHLR